MAIAKQVGLSEEAYLAYERASEIKHEYFQGEIFAMTGASRPHNLVVTNLLREISNVLLDQPCEVYPSDMRVRISETGLYTYPDVTIVCDKPQFADDAFDTLLNPTILFEVLSPSTEGYDRGEKFEHYRKIASLKQYVLVSQERVLLEPFVKQSNGQWLLNERHAGDSLELQSHGGSLAVDKLYLKVFP